MDKQAIIQEVYKKHGIGLAEKDPIFAAITINELVLDQYVQKFGTLLEEQSKQYGDQLTKKSKEHQELSVTQSNTILDALNEDFEAAEKRFRDLITQTGSKQLSSIQEAGKKEIQNVASSMKTFQVSLLVAVAVIFFLLGTAFKVYFP